MKYQKIECACGRPIGCNVFRQHARRCLAQLRAWKRADPGRDMWLLDERSEEQRRREGPV